MVTPAERDGTCPVCALAYEEGDDVDLVTMTTVGHPARAVEPKRIREHALEEGPTHDMGTALFAALQKVWLGVESVTTDINFLGEGTDNEFVETDPLMYLAGSEYLEPDDLRRLHPYLQNYGHGSWPTWAW